MALKRSKLEIMAWIVQECLAHKRKTHIMYRGNLSFAQTNIYLDVLTSSRLVSLEDGKYLATDKGHKFLETYEQLERMLQTSDSPNEENSAAFSAKMYPKPLSSSCSNILVEFDR